MAEKHGARVMEMKKGRVRMRGGGLPDRGGSQERPRREVRPRLLRKDHEEEGGEVGWVEGA